MKIQLASDLHLDMLTNKFGGTRIIEPAPEADVLVLAGDIASGTSAIEIFSDWPAPVIYAAGNHEFYDLHWEQTRARLREASADRNVRFLDRDELELDGVRFLGCTLWTDFELWDTKPAAMHRASRAMNDYHRIETTSGMLRPEDTLVDHMRSRRWLTARLEARFTGKTVVVTHHAPHPLSIHPRYFGNPLNAAFASELAPLVRQADLWLHGHVHDSFNYMVGGRQVCCSPAGYVRGVVDATHVGSALKFENRRLDRRLVIDLPIP